MASISCPYCRHVMELKGIHAGRFKPACPECRAQFQLTISADPKIAPEVVALGVGTETLAAEPRSASASAQASASSNHGSAATIVAPPRPPTVREKLEKTAHHPPTPPPSGDATVPVGLANRTVEQLSRQPLPERSAPVTPKWEAAAAASGHYRLGGYEIIKTLGEGGMGKVFLANQTSLARNVALKVLSPRLATDAQFVSRFTREAFAAAQLSHHNVVQIHDIGVERSKDNAETNYFSMEFVEGQTLGRVIEHSGKVDPATAVGYVLQAARGLKFAHDHGLIHRDVKPDNLLLNAHGIVKVADLGLVKRAGANDKILQEAATLSPAQEAAVSGKTLPSAVMGTPAYMPPEQAKDAGTVDVRADIYSLGCTLYHLLTGNLPFPGHDVDTILKAHAKQAIVPPERVVKDIPPALSQIVMKMVAKNPDERYADMGEVVTALEHCLGIESEKPFAPEQEQLKILELSAERFNTCTWKNIRKYSIIGFFIASLIAIVVLALPAVGHPLLSAGLFGYVITAVVSYQIIYGLARRSYLMQKGRELLFSSHFADWAQYVLFAELGVGLLIAFGLHWIWLAFSVAAVLSAFVFYLIVDNALSSERRISLEQTEKMIRSLRQQGTDENSIRHFICRYCGRNWEEFYEALFGFEAKLQARAAWNRGELGRTRPRFAAWREPIISWIDQHIQVMREEKQRKLLLKVESESLKAQGVDAYEANLRAKQNANRLIDNAAVVRAAALKRSTDVTAVSGAPGAGPQTEAIPKDWMHDGSDFKPRRRHRGNYFERRYGSPFDILFGRAIRLLGAMLILIAFGMWWSNNGAHDARNAAADLVQSREDAAVMVRSKVEQAVKINKVFNFSDPGAAPLRINHLPDWLCEALGCWNGAIAGILLLLSVFFVGRVMGFTVMMAAATALFGKHMPMSMFSETEWLVPATAVGIWLIAVLFLRDSSRD